MRRNRVAVVAVLLAVATACSSSGGDHPQTPIPAVNATTAPLLPTTANALPSVTFSQFQQLLVQLRGTPVVVNGWGSWCGDCRAEGPRLAAVARRFGRRVQFLGVDERDSRGLGQGFVRTIGWTYPSFFDPSANGDVYVQFGYHCCPVTLFFDRAGRIVDQVTGPATATELETGIRKILG